MGDEQLDSSDREDGRWMAVYLSSEQNPRDQADASAQSMDQRLWAVLPPSYDREATDLR